MVETLINREAHARSALGFSSTPPTASTMPGRCARSCRLKGPFSLEPFAAELSVGKALSVDSEPAFRLAIVCP
ncbi:hypothetical protein AJ87_43690 [Rhizobium yanglingense]|nr:hypothetical protein AJ87_43690 [Rhizobium yanglingense]